MRPHEPAPESCPDDELLARFVERHLDAEQHETLERHVATCAACADVVAATLTSAHDAALASTPAAGTAPVLGTTPRRRRMRATALAAGIVLALTGLIAYGGTHLVLAVAAREVARRVGAAVDAPVTIGRLSVGIAPDLQALTLRLTDVQIGGRAPMTAEVVEFAIGLAPLARGTPMPERLRLVRPFLHLDALVTADVAPGDQAPRSGIGSGHAVLAVLAGRPIEIRDGIVTMETPNAEPLRFTDVTGTTAPRPDGLALAFTGMLAGGHVTARGTIGYEPRPTADLTLAGTGLALAELPALRPHMSGAADVQLHVRGPATAPAMSGRLRLRDARAVGWNPLPALLDPASAPGLLAATLPGLAARDLPIEDVRLTFALHHRGGRIGRAFFATAGVMGTGSLRLYRDGALRGTGRVSLPPTLARAVLSHQPTLGFPAADGSLTLPFRIDGRFADPRLTLGP